MPFDINPFRKAVSTMVHNSFFGPKDDVSALVGWFDKDVLQLLQFLKCLSLRSIQVVTCGFERYMSKFLSDHL